MLQLLLVLSVDLGLDIGPGVLVVFYVVEDAHLLALHLKLRLRSRVETGVAVLLGRHVRLVEVGLRLELSLEGRRQLAIAR